MGELIFGARTLVMGIVNVTPDSFYPGSRAGEKKDAVQRALLFADTGADIVDVGGLSTRPGSAEIDVEEELRRVVPVIEEIKKQSGIIVSVDTYRSRVAEEAVRCGAEIINDISGLRYDKNLARVAAGNGVWIVLMHMRGMPRDMQNHAVYGDVVEEVSHELDACVECALEAGIGRERIIIDPGIGFAKNAEHNLILLKHLPRFKEKGFPVLVGLSRKSFLGLITGLEVEKRLIPTVAANAISIFQGADIIRVHDVEEARLTVRISDAIKMS
jgi:dihydropteroate synthase